MAADYPIHEAHGRAIFAIVEYSIVPASGNGWDEPREEAHAVLDSVRLEQRTQRMRYSLAASPTREPICTTYLETKDLGEAPAWVVELIEADDGFMSDLAFDDGYDADDKRVRLIDEDLMERRP